jgi:hypothetical protein
MPGNPEPESPRAPEPGLHALHKESSDGIETPCVVASLLLILRAQGCFMQLHALRVHWVCCAKLFQGNTGSGNVVATGCMKPLDP